MTPDDRRVSNHLTRVLVTDRDQRVRDGLTARINAHLYMSVVAAAATVVETLRLVADHQPDVAIIDPQLPDSGGLELCNEILAICSSTACVIHATSLDHEATLAATAVVLKELQTDNLITTIERIIAMTAT